MNALLDAIQQLGIAVRMQFVNDLSESGAAHTANFPIPDSQKIELDRRLKKHQGNPQSGSSLEQIAQKWRVSSFLLN